MAITKAVLGLLQLHSQCLCNAYITDHILSSWWYFRNIIELIWQKIKWLLQTRSSHSDGH